MVVSMERAFVNARTRGRGSPKFYEVVVFRSPLGPAIHAETDLLHRHRASVAQSTVESKEGLSSSDAWRHRL